MKKLISLLFLSLLAFFVISCDNDDDTYVDNDTYPVVLNISNENFTWDSNLGYNISKTFSSSLGSADMVLIYRQNGTSEGNPIWQQIPRTLYVTQGELDYDFDFTVNDIVIYAGGTYDLSTTPQYLNNQTFRVVLIPASQGKNANVDYSDYNSVIKYFKIDDSKVKTL